MSGIVTTEDQGLETQAKRPTSVSAWPVEEAELHDLPSGAVALLKRPVLMEMMRRGEIPNPLIDAAGAMMERRASPDYAATADLVAFIVASAFVEPRVLYEGEPGPDELPIEQIGDRDRTYIVNWINGVAELAPFRQDGAGAEARGDGGGIRDEAE